MKKRPDFICIGFQKCGTTSLYDLLKQHSRVYLTEDVKEPMFYRVPLVRRILGASWYEKRYFGNYEAARKSAVSGRQKTADSLGLLTGRRGRTSQSNNDPASKTSSREQISAGSAKNSPGSSEKSAVSTKNMKLYTGEVNAGLGFGGCAHWLGKDFPHDTKLLFMMRDPADRCYSAYKYFLALGFLPMSVVADDKKRGHAAAFDTYVRSVILNPRRRKKIMKKRMKYLCFSQGNYAYCIQEYLRYFSKENMKFVFFEDFIRNEEKETKDILRFFQIPEDPEMTFGVKSNETNFCPVSPLRSKIMYYSQGIYYALFEFLNLGHSHPGFFQKFTNFYDWIMDTCTRPETDTSKMLPATRRLLNYYYRNEIRKVEKLAGRKAPESWARNDKTQIKTKA